MKPSDNEIEMLAAGFAIQHKNGLIRFAHALLDQYAPQASEAVREAENVRTGYPYDDPAFEALCRQHDVWGTAMGALCAVFWRAALSAQPGKRKSGPTSD